MTDHHATASMPAPPAPLPAAERSASTAGIDLEQSIERKRAMHLDPIDVDRLDHAAQGIRLRGDAVVQNDARGLALEAAHGPVCGGGKSELKTSERLRTISHLDVDWRCAA